MDANETEADSKLINEIKKELEFHFDKIDDEVLSYLIGFYSNLIFLYTFRFSILSAIVVQHVLKKFISL